MLGEQVKKHLRVPLSERQSWSIANFGDARFQKSTFERLLQGRCALTGMRLVNGGGLGLKSGAATVDKPHPVTEQRPS